MPHRIIVDDTTYIIYDFDLGPSAAFEDLKNTKNRILTDNNNPIIVISNSFEGEIPSENSPASGLDLTQLHLLLTNYDSNNIVLINSDANVEENYTNWCKWNEVSKVFRKCAYTSYVHLSRVVEEAVLQENRQFKSKHFICMNAMTKPHRFAIVDILFANDWHTKGYISYLNRNGPDETLSTQNFQGQKLCLDFDRHGINTGKNQQVLPPQYSDACFDIVTESTVSDTSLFITEKTWKPILNKTPFIILGSKDSHKHLEEYFGIKPYTELFDYSFDNLDYPERLHRMKADNLDSLLNMDIHELNEIVNSDKMQELLEYNKARMLSHYKPEYMGDTSSKMKTLIDSINQTQA